ncbi:uncharacterized protein EKO05_0006025 [Ascochyta rabiei]|uniref:Uncharacterized protein n=1 Tax=Didymella rabiei TaxID=5454 RepID=A0A163M7V7_DIDRA|nr:uncharacterized protein EKO05_0006025 [Ascochyta rabiei]KZM28473.1 hypothetical protein ST47_g390 [Ascochyta rabiei]UPX15581.1 hypothetical protein EKO05_0006025 [Ascochyta rabiei]
MAIQLEFDVATGLYTAGGKEIANAVRRALTHPTTVGFVKRAVSNGEGEGEGDGEGVQIPVWGIVLLGVSFYAAIIAMSLLSYMLKEVIATLCMVETPHAAITVSPSEEPASKDEKEGLLETGPTITLVHQKPITSSIRGTIKHVVANAGRFARFRGFKIHALYSLVFALAVNFFSAFFFSLFPTGLPGQAVIVSALAGAAVANVHAAWTHKVVSLPSEATFWQRIPGKAHWKTLAPAAAISTAMPYISLYLTGGVAIFLGLHKLDQDNLEQYTRGQWMCLAARVLATIVFAIFTTLFLCIPAIVTQVRIESSILPEDQDTIVPFDRTFGGKVVSQMLGGSGKIGFFGAWRSFNWEARRRLLKLYVKIGAIMMFAMFVVGHVLAFEVFAVMGPQLGEFLAKAGHDGFVQQN